MNEKPETKIGYISPLKRICMTIGELPTSYLETMSYYEMLVWFVEFLKNQVIPVVNNNSEATEELQHLFIELQSYVNNYFDNLDVQEEINNKLDKMLEDGVLEQIIEQFLQSTALWGFDTVDDMKNATNLIGGSFAKTLGYYETNDGGGALYKITDTASETDYQEELENGLYATLIVDNIITPEQFGAKGDGETDDSVPLQNALNFLSNKSTKEIVLNKNKTYFVNSVLSIFKDSIINLNNSTIRGGQTHIFHNFKSTQFGWNSNDTFTEYNGNGNITIKNGTIQNGSISFIHGENILLENVNFLETNNDHYLEICACKNYKVINCNFKGMTEQASNRQYVEYVQIDSCDRQSFPWFNEGNITYDGTINENLIIENCTFAKSISPYNYLYTAIGNHVVTTNPHKNINIVNNIIDGCSNNSLRIRNMNNVLIKDNTIKNYTEVPLYFHNETQNVKIYNNSIIGDDSLNYTSILFNGLSNNATYENVDIKDNIITSENTLKCINLSSCNNCKVENNITNNKYTINLNKTTNLVVKNNTNYNKTADIPLTYYAENTDNSILYSDEKIDNSSNIATEGEVTTVTLNYPITNYNRLVLCYGFASTGSAMQINIDAYHIRKLFALEDKYVYQTLAVNGSVAVYLLSINATNDKLLTIEKVSGTFAPVREVYSMNV